MVQVDFTSTDGKENMASSSKEEHIKYLQNRIDARRQNIDDLVTRISRMEQANARDLIRLDELRLLKDIRDGHVTLVHAQTGKPINVHVFKNI